MKLGQLVLTVALPLSACSPWDASFLDAGRARPAPRAWFAEDRSQRIPGGEKCLSWLPRLGIRHERLPPRPGVATPVAVHGPIGGVEYRTLGESQVVADCRLILALDWIGPSLREFGISEVRHSGAYVYRTQRSGRKSLHASGLAIDLHAFVGPGGPAVVESDFARGLGDGCEAGAPELNRLVCELRRLRVFRELITPDHDHDHHDHVHVAISPRDEAS